jgi:hypothetical protein
MPATKTAKTIRPEELAKELGVSGKQIRAYLRANFPRDAKAKNTSWHLNAAQAKKVREAFAKKA